MDPGAVLRGEGAQPVGVVGRTGAVGEVVGYDSLEGDELRPQLGLLLTALGGISRSWSR